MTQTKSPSSLEAGRELDAMIAEKVMGWHDFFTSQYNGKLLGYPASYTLREGFPADHTANCKEVPHYSTDIAAAWQVVEKLRADCVFANIGPDPSEGGGYNCQFHWDEWDEEEDDHFIHTESASAPTAPLAICLAALKAVEGGEG